MVERFDVNHGAMWNVAILHMVECNWNAKCGIWHGVECCTMQDVENDDMM